MKKPVINGTWILSEEGVSVFNRGYERETKSRKN